MIEKGIYINGDTLITIAAIIAAVIALFGYYNKAYKWVQKQESQDKEIAAVKEELTLLTYGILAALKGLNEQGCNGPVTLAIDKIEKHMNKRAHDQEV